MKLFFLKKKGEEEREEGKENKTQRVKEKKQSYQIMKSCGLNEIIFIYVKWLKQCLTRWNLTFLSFCPSVIRI